MNTSIVPVNLRVTDRLESDQRIVVSFESGEIELNHSIAHRIEFLGKRCNLTLKNVSDKKFSVDVTVRVLNRALIEIWSKSEKWLMKSLMPGQSYTCSWEFTPMMPDVVWNEKARELIPAWVMVDAL